MSVSVLDSPTKDVSGLNCVGGSSITIVPVTNASGTIPVTGDKTIYPGRTYYYLIQIWHNVYYINGGTGLGEYVKDARIQGEAQVAVWLDCKDPTRGGTSANRCGSAGEIFDPNSFLFYPITEERSGSALYAASPMGKIVEDGSGGQDCINLLGLSEIEGHSQATFAACVLMNATQDVPFWSSDDYKFRGTIPAIYSGVVTATTRSGDYPGYDPSVDYAVVAKASSQSWRSDECGLFWSPAGSLQLAVAWPLLPTAPPPASPPRSSVKGDPHLHFAHGGRADFRGRDGAYYAFFTAPSLAVNVRVEAAIFTLSGGRLTVNGSFITEAHVVARVGGPKRKWANASYWASELNSFNTGWRLVNGTCGGHLFTLGAAGKKRCEELSISVGHTTATFDAVDWIVRVTGAAVFDRIAGPRHRLDIGFTGREGAAARGLPHGIIGQSFASSEPRYGKVDLYPRSGRFATSAQAEGAIAGVAATYEVPSPYETRFAFSRFESSLATANSASESGRSEEAGATS